MTDIYSTIPDTISLETGLKKHHIENVLTLLSEGATVPFIARYRKERTGSMDEVQVTLVRDRHRKLEEFYKRKETILETIESQDKLTDELRKRITDCNDPTILEDIYLPYKPKRRTRATIAKEKGLEPLAKIIMSQSGQNPYQSAARFVNQEVPDPEEALSGASDIIAEWISENLRVRSVLRRLFEKEAVITSTLVKGKEKEAANFSDYFDFSQPLRRMPSHRFLAVMRGEKSGYLKVSAYPDEDSALTRVEEIIIRGRTTSAEIISKAVKDSYKRLLRPSLETEILNAAKQRADREAIDVFAENLRQLLLSPPLGQKALMGIDPGFRTGCKVVCLDPQGDLLDHFTIYPHPPQNQTEEAWRKITQAVEKYKTEAVAVGTGTAGRETEELLKRTLAGRDIKIFSVNEDGASVYSASEIAREEFPDLDLTVRGAISIGRRLADPLAELVKIDPKSIGVGQYQHDVDQTELKNTLDEVTMSCVNRVGVQINTASARLLSYISGIGPVLAGNIVTYRSQNGPFASRKDLNKVPRFGPRVFEQAAGFLRITGATDPLDNTAVHPESYHIVSKMASDLGLSVSELISNPDKQKLIDPAKYVTPEAGLPTITDILAELALPGRDPRGDIRQVEFSDKITDIKDLYEGLILPGVITNVTDFGAFVNIGIKQDGLVHISQIADRFISKPSEAVKLNQPVTVKVTGIDLQRGRISLSMKGLNQC